MCVTISAQLIWAPQHVIVGVTRQSTQTIVVMCRTRSAADAEQLTKPAGAGVDVVVTSGDAKQH